MTDEELVNELISMGIDRASWKTVALLPLVQVAWADGRIQEKERKVIYRCASSGSLLEGRGERLLEDWLARRPTAEYLTKGKRLLARLAHRRTGLGSEMSTEQLEDILGFCVEVAEAAGGLFGIIGNVDPSERIILSEIVDELQIGQGVPWDLLVEELEEE